MRKRVTALDEIRSDNTKVVLMEEFKVSMKGQVEKNKKLQIGYIDAIGNFVL